MSEKNESCSSSFSASTQVKDYHVPLTVPEKPGTYRMVTFSGATAAVLEYTGIDAVTSDHPATWGQTERPSVDSFHTELIGLPKTMNYSSSGETTPWIEYTGAGSVTSAHPACLGPIAWFRELNSFLTSKSTEIVRTKDALLCFFPQDPNVGARFAKLLSVPGQPVYSVFSYGRAQSKRQDKLIVVAILDPYIYYTNKAHGNTVFAMCYNDNKKASKERLVKHAPVGRLNADESAEIAEKRKLLFAMLARDPRLAGTSFDLVEPPAKKVTPPVEEVKRELRPRKLEVGAKEKEEESASDSSEKKASKRRRSPKPTKPADLEQEDQEDDKPKPSKSQKQAKKQTKAKTKTESQALAPLPPTNLNQSLQQQQENIEPLPQHQLVVNLEDGLTPQTIINYSINTVFANGEQAIDKLQRKLAKERAKNLALMSVHGLSRR